MTALTDLFFSPDGALIFALALIGLALAAAPVTQRRRKQGRAASGERMALYRGSMVMLWSLAVLAFAGWLWSGRPLTEIGFAPVRDGWRGLAAWTIAAVMIGYCAWQIGQTLVSKRARHALRKQIGDIALTDIRPRNASEALHFQALSLTAGITEEIIFRGVLLAAFALVMPLWAAVVLSLIAFTLPHAYQGLAGLARVVPTGAVLTAIVLLGGSLWPAILAHALVDMTAGITFAILDRFENQDGAPDDTDGSGPVAHQS